MNTDRIEKQILLRAPLSRVWHAISDSTEFGTWFGMRLEGPFVAGKPIRGSIAPTAMDSEVAKMQEPHTGHPFELMIEQVEPERVLSFRWHPYAVEKGKDYSAEATTLVTFELRATPDGVLLSITESGFDQIPLERRAKAFQANEGGWAIQTKLIQKYVSHAG